MKTNASMSLKEKYVSTWRWRKKYKLLLNIWLICVVCKSYGATTWANRWDRWTATIFMPFYHTTKLICTNSRKKNHLTYFFHKSTRFLFSLRIDVSRIIDLMARSAVKQLCILFPITHHYYNMSGWLKHPSIQRPSDRPCRPRAFNLKNVFHASRRI